MKIQDFLKLVKEEGGQNIFVTCPDQLGLNKLIQIPLSKVATTEDVKFYSGNSITMEKARQIDKECRFAPQGSSNLTHVFIYGAHRIPSSNTGPLLKVVEEAGYARFIFQAQFVPRKLRIIKSRCLSVRLPFLPKNVVLGNIRLMNRDASKVEELSLYDGTLNGSIKNLDSKDQIVNLRRACSNGLRGLTELATSEMLSSWAFMPALSHIMTEEEIAFIRNDSKSFNRKIMVLYFAVRREDDVLAR